MPWEPIETMPRGKVVLTKIDDEKGERLVQTLKRGLDNNLLWGPDGTYVYYTPTHWFRETP